MGNQRITRGYHGLRYCSWARTHDDDGVARDGGHSAANRENGEIQPWFIAFILDIGHQCYCQLTPVKTEFLLTSITWSYRGLKCRAL